MAALGNEPRGLPGMHWGEGKGGRVILSQKASGTGARRSEGILRRVAERSADRGHSLGGGEGELHVRTYMLVCLFYRAV